VEKGFKSVGNRDVFEEKKVYVSLKKIKKRLGSQ
jgi:hypothetical protein